MKFYKRDPDRALAGMAELSLKQRGAYNSIIDLLYSRDGDVPDDDLRVSKMIRCHWREWAATKKQLIDLGKIWSEDGKLYANRVQETLKEAADFSQEQSRRASKGWQDRKKNNKNNDSPMPTGNASTATATPIEDSVPDGTGAVRAVDPAKLVFDAGVKWLGSYAITERNARKLVGKWRKRCRDPDLLALLAEAGGAERSNPVEYIEGCLKNERTTRTNGQAPAERTAERRRAIVEGLKDAGRLEDVPYPASEYNP